MLVGSQNTAEGQEKFLSKEDAAKLLGVSVRAIFRYIKCGSLRAVRYKNYVGTYESDCLRLLETWQRPSTSIPINGETIERMQAEIRTLRRDLDQVLRILNVRKDAMKLTDPEMVALYKTASQFSNEGWPPHVEEAWANYFLQLRVDNLRQLERQTGDKHPWRPFFRLVATMHLRPFNTELILQFSSARDHVLQTAQIWFDMKKIPIRALDRIIREEAKPSKVLLNRLGREQRVPAKE